MPSARQCSHPFCDIKMYVVECTVLQLNCFIQFSVPFVVDAHKLLMTSIYGAWCMVSTIQTCRFIQTLNSNKTFYKEIKVIKRTETVTENTFKKSNGPEWMNCTKSYDFGLKCSIPMGFSLNVNNFLSARIHGIQFIQRVTFVIEPKNENVCV